MYGDCVCLRGCMHVRECVCLYGGCVAFVCVSGNVCMVIVRACMGASMFVGVCVCVCLYGVCVVFVCVSLAMFVL